MKTEQVNNVLQHIKQFGGVTGEIGTDGITVKALTTGYMVAAPAIAHHAPVNALDHAAVRVALAKVVATIKEANRNNAMSVQGKTGDYYVGGWIDEVTNLVHIEASEQFYGLEKAIHACRARNQIALFDNMHQTSVIVNDQARVNNG